MVPPKRLIRRPTLSMARTHIPGMLTLMRGEGGTRNTLIRIRRLLDANLLMRRLA
jgi:hypothetical protein